jgi:putative ATPase
VAVDLFFAASQQVNATTGPLADRLRPSRLEDVVGQSHLLGPDGPLTRLLGASRLPSFVLWGPPGSGKTTIARLVATARQDIFVPLSAVTATVKDIRATVDEATSQLGMHQRRTVLFLDEIHRFTRTQQDALLPSVESGVVSLIGATTESPWATIVGPLLSRCTVFRLEPLQPHELTELATRATHALGVELDPDALELALVTADGDGRKLLGVLDVATAMLRPIESTSGSASASTTIALDDLRAALGAGDQRYGTGAHYDAASAFIKWMRHSEPDQAVAWLVHMLDGGEDPRFVARRMVIFASEDIGPADPRALLIADAAARAVDAVGMPEARYTLAQAASYLAHAPKSRRVPDELALALETERRLPPEMTGEA